MDEKPVATARASVMMFDVQTNGWVASGTTQGISKVQLFKHQTNNTYRVVGWKLADKEVVLNCAIFRGLKYNQARPTFHQWRDTKHQVYGLNFSNTEEAEVFATAMLEALESLTQIYHNQPQMDGQTQQNQSQPIMEYQQSMPPSINQCQISGNSSMPEYAIPQKHMLQMNIGTVSSVVVDNCQSYAPPMSSNGSISGISNDVKGIITEDEIAATPTVSAPPPPPPSGPPPQPSAPPPPPGPPPISNIMLGKQSQNDSDDDSSQSGLASQLRQARLKSRNATISEIEIVAANQSKNVAATVTPSRAGGDNMMSEMQRVLAARKKAKEVPAPKTECSDNGGSGDNAAKSALEKNQQRLQGDHEPLNGTMNNLPKASTEGGRMMTMQSATLGRKGSLQPESLQGAVTRQDLDIFKREIIQEVKTMIQQFKSDILDAIKENRP